MAIIGEILKRAVAVSHTIIHEPDPVPAQKKVLAGLLEKAENTKFGTHYRFRDIQSAENIRKAYASAVPYHDYDRIFKEWWKDLYEGAFDVTWPGKPDFFALSSGTTSNSKTIPVTDDMLESIRNAGIRQVLSLAEFDMPPSFFEKEVLMLGSSTSLKKVRGHLEGEISGISVYNIPLWFNRLFYKPGPEISSIDDWDERVSQIAEKAPEWDIGGLSGIPSWIELMLKKVIEHNKAGNIHDIWPNLQVYTSGGVSFEPYRQSFGKIFGRDVIILDTYLASEGYLATQLRRDTDSMALLTDNGVYFEFVPLKTENINEDGSVAEGAQALTIEEVEENVDYILIISTVAGAWRYMIGDTVMFTDRKRAEIKITGRTKYYLNVVGSQLSEFQMIKAVNQVGEEYNTDIQEFTVSAVKRGDDYVHCWYLGCNEKPSDGKEEIARRLDEILQEENKNYKVARSKALKDVEAELVTAKLFYDWTEKMKKKGGQTKVPKVMKEDEFAEWEAFASGRGY
ncbi:MAG: GH3 auxin-responsive promoter [Marinilabiliales bacterium]|nr:MAG: GH3 auxin-responsive promoter [Marinilabiliales bacterium]